MHGTAGRQRSVEQSDLDSPVHQGLEMFGHGTYRPVPAPAFRSAPPCAAVLDVRRAIHTELGPETAREYDVVVVAVCRRREVHRSVRDVRAS